MGEKKSARKAQLNPKNFQTDSIDYTKIKIKKLHKALRQNRLII